MKRILSFFVAACMILSAGVVAVEAADDTEGTCGNAVYWSLDTEGVLTIYGTGDMTGWVYQHKVPWSKYKSEIKKVIIEKGVASIGKYAFADCSSLEEVVIPDSVTSIGGYVFAGCGSLTSVAIPDSVTDVGKCVFQACEKLSDVTLSENMPFIPENAFENCSSLKNITIPESVGYIAKSAFLCSGLETITLPAYLETIQESAFNCCESLRSISIPQYVRNIGGYAFQDCSSLLEIYLPEGLESLNEYTFSRCSSLIHIEIPESVSWIGRAVFSDCNNLTGITIPSGVRNIPDETFQNCINLADVSIPDEVTWIGERAFYNCDNLTDIKLPSGIKIINKEAFESCGFLKEIIIPDEVTSISEEAFAWCQALETVSIPQSVKSIMDNAFSYCSNLTKVNYAGSDTDWEGIEIGSGNEHLINAYEKEEIPEEIKPDINTDVNIDTEFDPEYLPGDINNITIIENGDVFGRFLVYDIDGNKAANMQVNYSIDGKGEYLGITNSDGYLVVEIENIDDSAEYTVAITGDGIQPIEGAINVTVEPLHFESKFEAAFVNGAEVGVGVGVGGSIGNLGAEAKAAEIGVGGSKKVGLTMTQEYVNKKNKFTISAQQRADLITKAKVGLFAGIGIEDVEGVEASVGDVSGKASYGFIGGVGYEDTNFKLNDSDDLLRVGKFLLAASISGPVTNAVSEYIAEKLNVSINYFERGNAAVLGSGASLGVIEFGDSKVALGGTDSETAWTNMTKTFKDDSKEYSSGVSSDSGMSILKVDIGVSDNVGNSVVVKSDNFFEGDLTFRAKEDEDGYLEYVAFDSVETSEDNFLYDVETSSRKRTLTFEREAAEGIVAECDNLRKFAEGEKGFFSLAEFTDATEIFIDNDFRGKYSQVEMASMGKNLDLSASFDLGFEIGGALGVSGIYSYEYEEKNGIYENGTVYMQADNDISSLIDDKIITVEKLIEAAAEALAETVEEIFETTAGWLEDVAEDAEEFGKEVVASGKASVKKAKKTAKKVKVKITTMLEDIGLMSVLAVEDEASLFSASSVATTIGNPYVIGVEDESGNVVEDFSDDPLLLVLGYTQDELGAAQIENAENISILRWDEDKCVYVNMGGSVDTETMEVTLEITKPGQYILAVDNCEPAIVLFNQSHTGKNPVISAYVSDMSGIADFTLKSEDEIVIDMKNLDEYYNYTTGLLEYESKLDKSGTYTFTIYAKDTFGNEVEQKYNVVVNDEEPMIDNVTELGEVIGQGETITAIVEGEEVEHVLLNTLVTTSSGETYKLTVGMVEENGVYTGKVPMVANGSVAEIWISAYNIHGNKATSGRQACIIGSEDEASIGILSVVNQNVEVKCTNVDENSTVYLAVYNSDGAVVKVYSKKACNSVVFENVEDGAFLKAFAWSDTNDILPLSTSFTRKISK